MGGIYGNDEDKCWIQIQYDYWGESLVCTVEANNLGFVNEAYTGRMPFLPFLQLSLRLSRIKQTIFYLTV
jgi:hypothetical protein